jgi:hypothetical protein
MRWVICARMSTNLQFTHWSRLRNLLIDLVCPLQFGTARARSTACVIWPIIHPPVGWITEEIWELGNDGSLYVRLRMVKKPDYTEDRWTADAQTWRFRRVHRLIIWCQRCICSRANLRSPRWALLLTFLDPFHDLITITVVLSTIQARKRTTVVSLLLTVNPMMRDWRWLKGTDQKVTGFMFNQFCCWCTVLLKQWTLSLRSTPT